MSHCDAVLAESDHADLLAVVRPVSPSSDYATPLAALLQALERKGKLKDRTRSLSALLADRLLSSCLNQHCEAREAQDASKRTSLIFVPSRAPSQSSGLEALQLSLRFIGAHLFPFFSKERQADFSRDLLPKLVQPILTSLRATLPSRDVPADTIPARLEQTRALAHAICSTLTSSGLLLAPGAPSDQSPEDDHLGRPSRIATFANDVGRQYITKVANEARDEARRICSMLSLKDEKGWEAEEIEVDSELPPPPAHQLVDPVADGMEAKEVEGIVLSQGPNGGGGGDEWQWGDDDDGEAAQPAKASPRASLQRANSSASQNSNGSGGAPSSSAKAAAAKRAGRSALGGVRIVKPQDQMGSGPLPGEGGDEDDAWGFDDEADDTPAPMSAPVTKPEADVARKESRLAPPPPVRDDEDAWFADDEPLQPSTAVNQAAAAAAAAPSPPPASFAMPSSVAASTQPKAAPVQDIGEDDEDAWFTDEKQSSSGPPSSAVAPPPPSSSSAIHAPTFATPVDAGDHNDDAWFSEEVHSSDSAAPPPLPQPSSSAAVKAPVISAPSHVGEDDDNAWFTESAPSSSLSGSLRPPPAAVAAPTIDVDVDEDAWGLSEEEKAKRASMLVMGNHPALQALRDPEPPARAASGSSALADQMIDDDFDEDAWGLSSEEKAAKRASRLFPLPAQDVATDVPAVAPTVETPPEQDRPSFNLVHPIEPSQARMDESFTHHEPAPQEETPLTEENLEAAAAERESQAPTIETPLAVPSTLQPGASGPPSVVSTVSAIAPGSPRSGSARSTIAVPTADTTRADDTAGSALETAILTDNVSVAGSDVSRTHPFPIESALPESLPASDGAASEASLPATPRTGGQATLSSDSTFDRLGAAPPSEAAEADDDGTAPSPFPVESAQPVSASGVASPVLVATNSTSETLEHITAPDMVDGAATPPRPSGPPSIASLPPTPSAERLDFAPDDTQEAPSVSRPATPTLATAASQASSEMGDDPTIPFPIHSAVPLSLRYPHRQDSLSSSAPRTGPSSVASDSGAGSDAALPPSPMPERADDHDDAGSGWGFDEDDEASDGQEKPVTSRGRAETAVPSRPPASLLEAAEPTESTQEEPLEDGKDVDDPWADLEDATPEPAAETTAPPPAGDSQPLTKQALQTLSTEQDALQASEAQAKETSQEELAAAPASSKPEEQESGWDWDDEAGETAPAPAPAAVPAAPSSASSASKSPVAGRSRALSPLRNATKTTADASSPRSTASPQLRQATLRSASQARAAAAATATGAVAGIGAAVAAASSKEAPGQPPAQPVAAAREAKETPQAIPDAPRKETCRISSRSRQLVGLAHSLIDQAAALRDAEAAMQVQTTALLDPTLADIFDLHLALFTPEAAAALQQVPALSMQFVNDCRFLSREIMAVEERARKEFPSSTSSLSKRLTTTAQRTSLLATRNLTTHLSSHASHLSHLIATGCDSFLSVYNDDRFASCQRSLTQALVTVSGLDRSWRGTLSDSQRWTAIGALWEGAVVKRVWSDVLALDDVGEKEGERLAELIRGIGDDKVAGWFTMTKSGGDDAEEQEAARGRLATYVPSHLKLTGYLPEMLIGSLADVEYLLFDGGALAPPGVAIEVGGSSPWYVSRDEAKGLIRATFADSRRRTDLLARVARGV